MPKFNVNLTFSITSSLSKQVEAKDLNEATVIVIQNSKKEDWKSKRELKVHTK